MDKLSDFLGKPVISIYDSCIEGYVNNVLCDKKLKSVKYLQFFDDESQEEKVISTKDIYYFGKDAITIKNNSYVIPENSLLKEFINPINFEIYTIKGEKFSKVTDILLEDNTNIKKLFLQGTNEILPEDILCAGKNIAIKNEDKSVKISNFKKTEKIYKKLETNILVEMQSAPLLNGIVNPLPKKVLANNFDFLIGRKVEKNIYADNKELIIKKNVKISEQIIDIARKHGKLKQLTTYSNA